MRPTERVRVCVCVRACGRVSRIYRHHRYCYYYCYRAVARGTIEIGRETSDDFFSFRFLLPRSSPSRPRSRRVRRVWENLGRRAFRLGAAGRRNTPLVIAGNGRGEDA